MRPRLRARGASVALLGLVVAWTGLGCAAPAAVPLPSGDPANGVTITNAIDSATVMIVYERPDGGTETLLELQPGQHAVVDSIFEGREGLCRTGRLVALVDGAEIDELYLVCRDRTWAVQTP